MNIVTAVARRLSLTIPFRWMSIKSNIDPQSQTYLALMDSRSRPLAPALFAGATQAVLTSVTSFTLVSDTSQLNSVKLPIYMMWCRT